MVYFFIAFALLMGILFALMAYNKKGTVGVPIAGAIAFILFWVFFNALNFGAADETQCVLTNPVLWLEATITAFIGAIVGIRNTTEKKKSGYTRFLIPALLLIVYIVL